MWYPRNEEPAMTGNSSVVLSGEFMCRSIEGWGPLSNEYYDFTPCFVAVPLAFVALFGTVVGSFTIWRLWAGYNRQPTPRDWHYYGKLVGSIAQQKIFY
jgi:hypothetical protein